MEDDGDLALQDNEDHRVLVRAAHALSAVTLDPVKRSVRGGLRLVHVGSYLRNERRW